MDPIHENDIMFNATIRNCDYKDHSLWFHISWFIFQCLYAFPISTIYFYTIMTILRSQQSEQVFSNSYWRIYVTDGIVSVTLVILDFSLTRPLIFVNPLCYIFLKWFPAPTYILTPYLYFFNYFQFAKIFSITLLSANRFTCVALPIWHKQFWKKYINVVIIVAMCLPTLFTWQLIAPARFDPYQGEALLGYEHRFNWFLIRTTTFKLIVSSFSFLFIVFSNIYIYCIAKKIKSQMKELERTLTLTTLVISIVYMTFIGVQILLLYFTTTELIKDLAFGGTVKKIELFCNDFYLMSSPIVLLITNKRLRATVLNFKKNPVAPMNTVKSQRSGDSGVSGDLIQVGNSPFVVCH